MSATRLLDLLGIEHPVLLAPMAGVAGGELTSAVSQAGGFGILGGGYGDPNFLENQISLIDTNCPVGIGFITWKLMDQPELLDIALAANPKAILLSFGDPTPFVEKIKTSGTLLIAQCQSLQDATKAADLGADIIVAQGTEAGGHGSNRATMSLLPAVADALPDTCLVGAGGIADGRGLAASLMLGADGVMLGSRFYVSKESLATAMAKTRAIDAGGDDTTRSSVFDVLREYNWPKPYNLRALKNTLSNQYENNMPLLVEKKSHEIARFNAAVANQDYDAAPVIVGEAVDLINELSSAEKIISDIVRDAKRTIADHQLVKL